MTAVAFLRGHMVAALAAGYQVDLVAKAANTDFLNNVDLTAVRFHPVAIQRSITPLQDIYALWQLFTLFRREKFQIVHSVSPKAGLLAMLASRFARSPNRIHTFTGQVWVTRTGWSRRMLKIADRILAMLATRVLVDSYSQRSFLASERVVGFDKSHVIGNGSISGVNGKIFRPDRNLRSSVRKELNISEEIPVLLFLGRIAHDKGVCDLVDAFLKLSVRFPTLNLLFVGPDEGAMADVLALVTSSLNKNIHFIEYTTQPERYMAAADILCLPSYREGFGMVLIQAAATGLPVVASRINGVIDAVLDGETGLLHAPGNVDEIINCISLLLSNPDRSEEMGKIARNYALSYYTDAFVTQSLLDFYRKLLSRD